MDHPTNTSQRIRPILRAMDRLIDEARRKRSGKSTPLAAVSDSSTPIASHAPAIEGAIAPTPAPGTAAPGTPAGPTPLHSATQAANQSIRPQSMASTPPNQPAKPASEPSPEQPVRLKARPKRWLPASA